MSSNRGLYASLLSSLRDSNAIRRRTLSGWSSASCDRKTVRPGRRDAVSGGRVIHRSSNSDEGRWAIHCFAASMNGPLAGPPGELIPADLKASLSAWRVMLSGTSPNAGWTRVRTSRYTRPAECVARTVTESVSSAEPKTPATVMSSSSAERASSLGARLSSSSDRASMNEVFPPPFCPARIVRSASMGTGCTSWRERRLRTDRLRSPNRALSVVLDSSATPHPRLSGNPHNHPNKDVATGHPSF